MFSFDPIRSDPIRDIRVSSFFTSPRFIMKLAQTFYMHEELKREREKKKETIKTRFFRLRINPSYYRIRIRRRMIVCNLIEAISKAERPKLNISTTIYRGNLLWLPGEASTGVLDGGRRKFRHAHGSPLL